MAYDRVVSRLNTSRLQGTSFPVVHALIEASLTINNDVRSSRNSCPIMSLITSRSQETFK